MKSIRVGLLIMVFAFGPAQAAEKVALRDTQGREVQVEILSADKSSVVALVNGTRHSIPLSQLDAASASLAVDHAKKAGTYSNFPALDVQVKVGVSRRNYGPSGYMKKMEVSPSAQIRSKSQLIDLPAFKTTMVILFLDTRSKFVDRAEKYAVESNESMENPGGPGLKPVDVKFTELVSTYDGDRDTTNIGGGVYKYYAFFINDAESGDNVHFESNWPALQKRMLTDPDLRKKVANLQKGVPLDSELAL